MEPVEGGLAEPTELEPDQGTLALALPGRAATRADWEKAAAGVLRKAGRLREGDADDAVWAALTRATLDGVGVSPLGTPDLTDATGDHARPTSPGGRDVRVELRGSDDARLNAEALADLDGGASSLWLHAGPDTDLAVVLDGVLLDLAGVVLDATSEPVALAERFLAHLGDTTAGSRHQPGCSRRRVRRRPGGRRAAGPRRRRPRGRGRRLRRPRPGRVRRPGARLVDRRRRAGPARPRGGRHRRRAGGRPGRVPLRRDRRPVPDHRQAAGGPAALVAAPARSAGQSPPTSGSTPSPAGR